MTYPQFETAMTVVKKDYEWMDKVSDCFQSDVLYEHLRSPGQLLDTIALIFGGHAQDWIDYYCFDLDWGTHWRPGAVKDAAGNDIPLKTLEDLYRLLTENKEVMPNDQF